MIYKVWERFMNMSPKEEKETVLLRLVSRADEPDGVTLIACDVDGERLSAGSILTLYPDGSIQRHAGVESHVLDGHGTVQIRG